MCVCVCRARVPSLSGGRASAEEGLLLPSLEEEEEEEEEDETRVH